MISNKIKKIVLAGVIGATALPMIVSAASSITQYFISYSLGGQQSTNMEFEVSSSDNHNYQNNNVTVSTLYHDAGGSECRWADGSTCKFEVTGKKKGLIFYNTVGSNTINTPTTGYYNGANYGNVGSGKFRYTIKNNGALSTSGTFRVNAQDTSN